MSQERSAVTYTNRQNSDRQNTVRENARYRQNQDYIDGSAAKQLKPIKIQQPARRTTTRTAAKQIRRTQHLNVGYMLVLIAAMTAVCVILMSYVTLQADITNRIEHISSMESELNDLKLSNDETYTKIMTSVDLEEIKRIAIQELGMKYAKEGQVITYTGEGSDYVRQYSDIPE